MYDVRHGISPESIQALLEYVSRIHQYNTWSSESQNFYIKHSRLSMQQLVKVPTRAKRTLDVFITNCPFLWKLGSPVKGLVRSDHLAIIVHPSTPGKPIREKVSFRDSREHCKIAMDLRLEGYDWSILSYLADLDESGELLSQKLWEMYNDCFPLITVNLSSRDPPYMSPLVKHLC